MEGDDSDIGSTSYDDDLSSQPGGGRGHGFGSSGASVLDDRRSVKACDACHKAKAKCSGDGAAPCPSCVKRGLSCVYSAAKKRGPKTGALKALQEEVAVLRNQLKSVQYHGGGGGHGGHGSGSGGAHGHGRDGARGSK
jgi:hypothetical protein